MENVISKDISIWRTSDEELMKRRLQTDMATRLEEITSSVGFDPFNQRFTSEATDEFHLRREYYDGITINLVSWSPWARIR